MTELLSLFAKQTSSGEKKVLPLLHGIDAAYLADKFPLLSDVRAEMIDEARIPAIVSGVMELIRRVSV